MTAQGEQNAAAAIRVVFNGPALAGIGATTDAGLVPAKYHALPWSPKDKVKVNIGEGVDTLSYTYEGEAPTGQVKLAHAIKVAVHNVDNIFGWDAAIGVNNAITQDVKDIMKRDCIAIVFVMIAHGYYDKECREMTPGEKNAVASAALPDGMIDNILNTETLNRAATFILARMHTKYQTNHVLGGRPMQASMASAVRAFYGVSPGVDRDNTSKEKASAIATMLHWALHPANERLLIPAVIDGSFIDTAYAHKMGPKVTALGKEEYFSIRAKTPPASTHHYYVAASAVQHLEPLGILPYMPTVAQMKDIKTGWLLIATHGARLHPAARHWGLQRISANQKLVEPVCADLGYAIKKLMPNSSLAASPILAKEEALNSQWKAFVDAIRASMDKRGEEMLDKGIMEDIKRSILPTKGDTAEIVSVKRLMIQASTAPSADGGSDGGDEQEYDPNYSDDDDDDAAGGAGVEGHGDGSDDDEDGDGNDPPGAGGAAGIDEGGEPERDDTLATGGTSEPTEQPHPKAERTFRTPTKDKRPAKLQRSPARAGTRDPRSTRGGKAATR